MFFYKIRFKTNLRQCQNSKISVVLNIGFILFMQNRISFWLISVFLLQESEKEVVCLKQTLQRSKKDFRSCGQPSLRKKQKHKRRAARLEQLSKLWAQDIHSECVCLQELLKHNGLAAENKNSSDRCAYLFVVHTVCSCIRDFYLRHCALVLMWGNAKPK